VRKHASKKSFTENGSIPKTVMNDILNDQIGDFENTPISPSEEKMWFSPSHILIIPYSTLVLVS
jgi:hypothetical protein